MRDSPQIAMLRKCEQQFLFYADQHRLKIDKTLHHGSVDPHLEKALVNERLAAEIRDVLR